MTKKPARPAAPATLARRRREIIAHTDAFCAELLNDEYRDMCRVMAKGFCTADSPALEGDARTWAAAIVAAVGFVNFLDDPEVRPYISKRDLAKKLGVPIATLKKHTNVLIKGFDLIPGDLDFTLPSLMSMNPWVNLLSSPSVLLRQCCGGAGCGPECGNCEDCDGENCCRNQAPVMAKRARKSSPRPPSPSRKPARNGGTRRPN